MRISQTNSAVIEARLESDEMLQPHLLLSAAQRATERGVLNLDLVILPYVAHTHADLLRENGFIIAGNLSIDNVTFLRMRRAVHSGEGVSDLAVPTPQLPPTREESAAVEYVKQNFAKSLSERRLAELAAMGKNEAKDEPEAQPDLVIEHLKEEIKRMEAALKSEQEETLKPEKLEAPKPELKPESPDPDQLENRRACVQWTPL